MSIREMWDALWQYMPVEMAVYCAMTAMEVIGFTLVVVLGICAMLGFGEEDELWEK